MTAENIRVAEDVRWMVVARRTEGETSDSTSETSEKTARNMISVGETWTEATMRFPGLHATLNVAESTHCLGGVRRVSRFRNKLSRLRLRCTLAPIKPIPTTLSHV